MDDPPGPPSELQLAAMENGGRASQAGVMRRTVTAAAEKYKNEHEDDDDFVEAAHAKYVEEHEAYIKDAATEKYKDEHEDDDEFVAAAEDKYAEETNKPS